MVFDSIHRGKMNQIQLAYRLPKETVNVIMMLYKNAKAMVHLLDGNTNLFDIIAGVLQVDILPPDMFMICLDYVLWSSIDQIKENGFTLKKERSGGYPGETMINVDYADNLRILTNASAQAKSRQHSPNQTGEGNGPRMKANKIEFMCFKQ